MHYAIDRKHTETALLLIRSKADINKSTTAGYAPLAFAARSDEVAVVNELLSRRVSVDVAAAENDGTPLMFAAESGATNAAAVLIAAGADVNRRYSVRLRNTILMEAAWYGQLGSVKLLLEHGANLEGTDNNGNTALTCAANAGRTNVVQYLLKQGANRNATNRNGWTALMQAVEAKQLESVRVLLEAGADVNRKGPGTTALMIAARESSVEVVRCLVDHGADVKAESDSGWTALRYAEVEKRYEIVNVLLAALEAEKRKADR
jgi:ankyrin repeat protein